MAAEQGAGGQGHVTTCLHFRGAPRKGSGHLGILLKLRGPLLPVGRRVDWVHPHARLLPRGTVASGPCGLCTWQCWWRGRAQTWRLGPSPVVTGRTVGQQRQSVLSGLR